MLADRIEGCTTAGAYALDSCSADRRCWQLCSIFVTDAAAHGTMEPALPALAHRVCVEFCFDRDAAPGADPLRGPLWLSLQRKWHSDGFSLAVGSSVARGIQGKTVSTGLDADLISRAVPSDCFTIDGGHACAGEVGAEVRKLVLPAGVELRLAPTWLEVSLRGVGHAEKVLRREFSAAAEGQPWHAISVQV